MIRKIYISKTATKKKKKKPLGYKSHSPFGCDLVGKEAAFSSLPPPIHKHPLHLPGY